MNTNTFTNQVIYQNSNILENFYTDNHFNYIFTSSLYCHRNSFLDIISYSQTYIPEWKPVTTNSNNRIIFNTSTMFELLFYKNLILVIPLYISNYSLLENNLFQIKNYCENYILAENKNNTALINTINYKLIIYSTTTAHNRIQYKPTPVTTTIINTILYTNMYESLFFPLPEAVTPTLNPLYTPFAPSSLNLFNSTGSGVKPLDTQLNTIMQNEDKMKI